ncbi:unnamed protein product, partial [Ixodes pacificus]
LAPTWLLVSTTRIAFYASGAARVRRSRASSATRDPRVADTETWEVSSPHRRLGCKLAVDRRSVFHRHVANANTDKGGRMRTCANKSTNDCVRRRNHLLGCSHFLAHPVSRSFVADDGEPLIE